MRVGDLNVPRDRLEFAAFSPEQRMEAERINAIESSLADLDARSRELRRYL
jgi:hypothetical protein